MATSGQLQGNHVTIGGNGGNYYFINWQVAGQDVGSNGTHINWQAYMHFNNADAQLDNGQANLSGSRWNNGGRVKNFESNFTTRNVQVASGTFFLPHNSNGTQSISVSGGLDVYGVGRSSGSASWDLPTIPRQVSITSYTQGSTDTQINIGVSTSRTADAVDYSLNGGGWVRAYTGDFSSRSFSITGLNPNTSYSVKIRVKAKDSQLWTESGTASVGMATFQVNTLSITGTSDTTLAYQLVTNYTASAHRYRVNGGSWVEVSSGNFTTTSNTITSLTPSVTYTIDVQARHAASGVWSATKTTTGTTNFATPKKSIDLAPAGGLGVNDLTPDLSWVFTANGAATQGFFALEIIEQSDESSVLSVSKTAQTASTYTVPGSTLDWDVQYLWRVKTWSAQDIEGVWSDYALFKTSEAPTAAITAPEDDDELSTATPLVTWTYTDPQSTIQAAFRIIVEEETSELVVFDIEQVGDALAFTIPDGPIKNETSYVIKVAVKNGDGIWSAFDEVTVDIEFIAPPSPNIDDIDQIQGALYNFISVSKNEPAEGGFDTDFIWIYRRVLGEEAWTKIAEVEAVTGAGYFDYELANNTTYQYAALAYNLEEGLTSDMVYYTDDIVVVFPQLTNIYLVPLGNESASLGAFVEDQDAGKWSTKTATAYHFPVGSKYPTVYTQGNQKYRQGSIALKFFNPDGLAGIKKVEAIMNHKPILLRLPYGELIVISIDGDLQVDHIADFSWIIRFNFTEVSRA